MTQIIGIECIEHPWRTKTAYGYYQLKHGRFRDQYLHRVLYANHHGIELKSTDIVRHLCNNPSCLEVRHMELGSQKENVQDQLDAGTFNRQKLTKEEVKEIRRLYKRTNLTQRELAEMFDISTTQISRIVNGIRW